MKPEHEWHEGDRALMGTGALSDLKARTASASGHAAHAARAAACHVPANVLFSLCCTFGGAQQALQMLNQPQRFPLSPQICVRPPFSSSFCPIT